MGGSKQTQKSEQQSSTTTQLPAWVTQAGQDLYTKASAAPVVGQYQGQMTAGPTANQTAASTAAATGAGAWKPALAASTALTTAGATAPAASVTAAQFDPAAAARYANPYQQQVQANTLETMRRQDAADHATLNDGVQGAKAFGGSRQGVLEAAQARDQAKARSDYVDSSNAAAFESGRAQFNQDADRSLQGQTTNAGLWEQMLSRMMGGGAQLGQTAEATSNLGSRDIANLASTGATDQATQNAGLDAQYRETLRAGAAPLENYKDLMAILAGTPRNVTTSGTSSGTSVTQQNPGLFNQLLAGGQLAASAFSDRRLKTGIERVDELENGLGVYRYSYVWDRPDVPLRIGVMADEVERLMPEALGPVVAGFATVNYAKLGGLLTC